MKLTFLIVASLLLTVLEFIFARIIPEKTKNRVLIIVSTLIFLAILYLHPSFIYYIDTLWNHENEAKVIIPSSFILFLVASFIYHIYNKRK